MDGQGMEGYVIKPRILKYVCETRGWISGYSLYNSSSFSVYLKMLIIKY